MKKLLLAFLLLVSTLGAETRGERNFNPGNIRPKLPVDFSKWPGSYAIDDYGALRFKKPVQGIRAIVVVLKKYRAKGVNTPYSIVARWTYGDTTSKQKQQYAKVLCEYTGKRYNQKIDLYVTHNLEMVTRAIIYYENGHDPYPESEYRKVFAK